MTEVQIEELFFKNGLALFLKCCQPINLDATHLDAHFLILTGGIASEMMLSIDGLCSGQSHFLDA